MYFKTTLDVWKIKKTLVSNYLLNKLIFYLKKKRNTNIEESEGAFLSASWKIVFKCIRIWPQFERPHA